MLREMPIRVRVVHYVAKALGVLVRIDGLPYGSARNLRPLDSRGAGGIGGRAR